MIIIGVDPGMSGGIAVLGGGEREEPRYIDAYRMPIKPWSDEKNVVDAGAVAAVMGKYDPLVVKVVLEKQRPFPTFGKTGLCPVCKRGDTTQSPQVNFGVGRCYGIIEGICGGLGLSECVQYAEPQTWKKFYGLKGGRENKEAGLVKAREFYPDAPLQYKKDEGVAEALLIARWWWLIGRKLW